MLSKRTFLLATFSATLGNGAVWRITSAAASSRINILDSPEGAAIKGYDTVAYFAAGAPTPGSSRHAISYEGATWLFANDENRRAFQSIPERYAPAYGGYCAYGVSRGYLVKIEPDAWSIRDGRLYLNYDRDVRRLWLENPAKFIAAAERNWPGLSGQTQ